MVNLYCNNKNNQNMFVSTARSNLLTHMTLDGELKKSLTYT